MLKVLDRIPSSRKETLETNALHPEHKEFIHPRYIISLSDSIVKFISTSTVLKTIEIII